MELLIFILSFLYLFIVINIGSLIVNLRYIIYFKFNDLLGKIKAQLDLYTTEVYNIHSLFKTLKKIIPEYHYDPLKGALNWLAWVTVTLGRTLYLPHEKHSKDCYEHSRVVKYLIDNSVLSKKPFVHEGVTKKYNKTEILFLFSVKPLIRKNHAITIAYWEGQGDKYIDVFAPYWFVTTIKESEIQNIPKIIEGVIGGNTKYSKYWVTSRV